MSWDDGNDPIVLQKSPPGSLDNRSVPSTLPMSGFNVFTCFGCGTHALTKRALKNHRKKMPSKCLS